MSANPLQACLDVLISPDTAFDGLHSKKGWWLAPFLLINASFVAMFLYYFANVDFPWLKEIMLDQIAAGEEMTAEDLEVISGSLQQSSMTVWSIVGSIFFVLFLNSVLAIYLNIATKFSGKNEFGFVDWFGLGWWISMPHVVAVSLSMLMVMFSTSGMISLENLSVTTFNSLIFGVDATSSWFNFLNGIDLLMFWSIALIAMGLKSWLGMDTKKAGIIALAPYGFLYGVWALFILLG